MDLKKTALVLIDMQKESNYDIVGLDEMIHNAQFLIEQCRSTDIPVIYTRQINRNDTIGLSNNEPLNSDGSPVYYDAGTNAIEIFDSLKPASTDIVIDKYRWSAFFETSLDLMLKSLGVEHLIIGGLVTDGCVMTTVFDGYFRDYQINLVKDMCGTTSVGAHMSSILMMANWIYDLHIFETAEMVKKIKGEDYHSWKPAAPDQLHFTPENMREVFREFRNDERK
ncbi:MAG TPA: isochorismatase family cysteine hydrolase [Bacillales bacterium]|nr:isochorismatase family cysteine hydrolase [Bacillales bacterium]